MTRILKEDLPRHELIGLKCKVVRSTNPSLLGKEGMVVDETKNLIVLLKLKREYKIPKKEVTFQFLLDGDPVEVDGKFLKKRPEDRIK